MPATNEKSVKHGGMPGQGETVDPRWPLSGCLAKKRKSKKLEDGSNSFRSANQSSICLRSDGCLVSPSRRASAPSTRRSVAVCDPSSKDEKRNPVRDTC